VQETFKQGINGYFVVGKVILFFITVCKFSFHGKMYVLPP